MYWDAGDWLLSHVLLLHILTSLLHYSGSKWVHRTVICLPATAHWHTLALETTTGATDLLALWILDDRSMSRTLYILRPVLNPSWADTTMLIATPLLYAFPYEDTRKDAAETAEHTENKT